MVQWWYVLNWSLEYFILTSLINSSYLVSPKDSNKFDKRQHAFQQKLLFELYWDQSKAFLAMLQRLKELYSKRWPTWLKSLSSHAPQSPSYSTEGAIDDQDF